MTTATIDCDGVARITSELTQRVVHLEGVMVGAETQLGDLLSAKIVPDLLSRVQRLEEQLARECVDRDRQFREMAAQLAVAVHGRAASPGGPPRPICTRSSSEGSSTVGTPTLPPSTPAKPDLPFLPMGALATSQGSASSERLRPAVVPHIKAMPSCACPDAAGDAPAIAQAASRFTSLGGFTSPLSMRGVASAASFEHLPLSRAFVTESIEVQSPRALSPHSIAPSASLTSVRSAGAPPAVRQAPMPMSGVATAPYGTASALTLAPASGLRQKYPPPSSSHSPKSSPRHCVAASAVKIWPLQGDAAMPRGHGLCRTPVKSPRVASARGGAAGGAQSPRLCVSRQ